VGREFESLRRGQSILGVDKPTIRSYTKDNKRVRAAEFPGRRQTLPMPVIPVEIFFPKEVDLLAIRSYTIIIVRN
tara:strand:- start:10 stop:234 length:225 start_codon:yes stop_codon:yes gene_type:complete